MTDYPMVYHFYKFFRFVLAGLTCIKAKTYRFIKSPAFRERQDLMREPVGLRFKNLAHGTLTVSNRLTNKVLFLINSLLVPFLDNHLTDPGPSIRNYFLSKNIFDASQSESEMNGNGHEIFRNFGHLGLRFRHRGFEIHNRILRTARYYGLARDFQNFVSPGPVKVLKIFLGFDQIGPENKLSNTSSDMKNFNSGVRTRTKP